MTLIIMKLYSMYLVDRLNTTAYSLSIQCLLFLFLILFNMGLNICHTFIVIKLLSYDNF